MAAGGDRLSTTPGLIPRIHERLLGEHNARGSGRGGGGRGNTATGGGSVGVRERQTFMRGGGRGGFDMSVTSDFAGGGGRAATAAEWRLCDQRTKHCTQRGSHGSGFSCGYRNIQMLCSALMEWPEYKRVLFGGSGCIPGVALLQCWIERAWADGYDPDGCAQLGGLGALMGSETWIGATECATLLRQACTGTSFFVLGSFGVKAEVIDFESSAPLAPAFAEEASSAQEEPEGGSKRKTPSSAPRSPLSLHPNGSTSSRAWPSGPSSPDAYPSSNGGRGVQASVAQGPVQQSIRSFLPSSSSPSSTPRDRSAVTSSTQPGGAISGIGGGLGGQHERRWPGAGQRLGNGGRGRGRGAAGRDGFLSDGGGRGGRGWRGGRGGRGWGGRGGRGGAHRKNGYIGKDAGDRMGKALAAWAWEYFCTPWGTAEGGSSSISDGGKGAELLLPPPSRPPSQLREPGGSGGGNACSGRGSGSSSRSPDAGGAGSGGTATDCRAEAWTRPPPPLYFQHDGHSRSIVGVLRPGGAGQRGGSSGGGRGRGGGSGGGSVGGGRESAGSGRGRGGAGSRQAACLLVFDPSHAGGPIRDALDDTQKGRWGRFLKRGEHALHRRQFQMVAVRPGLVNAGQVDAWKRIVSEKIVVD
ncbi:unnamed protein product [Ectocarpus sp. 6 AP-2014]